MTPRLLALTLAAALFAPRPAAALDTLYVFKASMKLPVQQVVVRPTENTDLILTRKIGEKELVNLALGRPLASKVDKKTEILAWAGTFENPSSSALARLIVFDPTQNGIAQVKATVMRLQTLDYATAYLGKTSGKVGFATIAVQPTVLGNPSADGFVDGTLNGSGTASGAHLAEINGEFVPPSFNGKGIVGGRIHFKTGGADVDGFVPFGKTKIGGKILGSFEQ